MALSIGRHAGSSTSSNNASAASPPMPVGQIAPSMSRASSGAGRAPHFESIGWWAPAFLVLLRLAQGLALGGEYGGAATYVAEHAPDHRRGYATSWIQTTATVGFFMALLVIYACRAFISPADFGNWGWRIPFVLSLILLAISIYIRLKLQ